MIKTKISTDEALTLVRDFGANNYDRTLPARRVAIQSGRLVNLSAPGKSGLAISQSAMTQILNMVGMPVSETKKELELAVKRKNVSAQDAVYNRITRALHSEVGDRDILVRSTKNGQTRAVFSREYAPLDNFEILSQAAPSASSVGRLTLNDDGMFATLLGKDNMFDTIYPAVNVRNSEVGKSSVSISYALFRLVCSNGMTAAESDEYSMRRKHTGNVVDFSMEFLNNSLNTGNPLIRIMKRSMDVKVPSAEERALIYSDNRIAEKDFMIIENNLRRDTQWSGKLYGFVNALTQVAHKNSTDATKKEDTAIRKIMAFEKLAFDVMKRAA